ncbi:hypothetical protein ABT336_13325 [Micromonospora sp. NPDC000207]|uniref:hypothetical protein n=1 Tax=Micromonospora sp. NPDC000207 TaxID=3154246 RepID=UPI0033283229
MVQVVFTRFKLNRSARGFAGIALSPKIRDAVHDVVERTARPYAVGISPSATGTYRRSWQVDDVIVPGAELNQKWPLTRVGTRLVNKDPSAKFIEIGGAVRVGGQVKPTPARHVLGRTLDHLDALSGRVRGAM